MLEKLRREIHIHIELPTSHCYIIRAHIAEQCYEMENLCHGSTILLFLHPNSDVQMVSCKIGITTIFPLYMQTMSTLKNSYVRRTSLLYLWCFIKTICTCSEIQISRVSQKKKLILSNDNYICPLKLSTKSLKEVSNVMLLLKHFVYQELI